MVGSRSRSASRPFLVVLDNNMVLFVDVMLNDFLLAFTSWFAEAPASNTGAAAAATEKQEYDEHGGI